MIVGFSARFGLRALKLKAGSAPCKTTWAWIEPAALNLVRNSVGLAGNLQQ
jgi:hypothetical protein